MHPRERLGLGQASCGLETSKSFFPYRGLTTHQAPQGMVTAVRLLQLQEPLDTAPGNAQAATLGLSVQGQGLDSMIPLPPSQLSPFCSSHPWAQPLCLLQEKRREEKRREEKEKKRREEKRREEKRKEEKRREKKRKEEKRREIKFQLVISGFPIWPVCKPEGKWRLTVDYRALNEVTPPLSAAVPDMLELQYELESKAAKCPTICHGLIQAALEKGEAPEHLQYIDDIIVWGNTAMKVFEKGETIIQILLKAGFAIKKSKVKGPAREIQFLGVKWHDGRRQIPTEVINKITAMCPPTNKRETQAFLGAIGFWRMHIPEYSQIIKQEIAHAVALGPVRTGPEVKNVLYSAAGNNGLSWSLWQKVPGETRGRPLGFWSRNYRGSETNYTPTEKEILAAYEGVQAASEVVGTETQLLLAPRLPVLGWMFKAEVPSTHHATNATWSNWIALITQRTRIGNPNRPGILEIITNWPEGENFGLMDEEEQEQMTGAEEAPPYNQLPAEETRYALFTDGSCHIVGMKRKWKAAVWSPTRQVAQATEGEGGSSQLTELKAVQLALDIAEREKWPKLYLYTDSWMVANALWGWLDRWKKAN
ncbi:hypothetical protein DUI87_35081 [Hirundo rustica rustica]|uniref:RNase H type-1 domain-containing protein n=1 Tax=Hirundo rustica rustica TaxID=333673 RepID=A0A3M0IKJ2_HIRRU|nr:hypothetical protein DUI87_35081 [Hirundo rustica rustica]